MANGRRRIRNTPNSVVILLGGIVVALIAVGAFFLFSNGREMAVNPEAGVAEQKLPGTTPPAGEGAVNVQGQAVVAREERGEGEAVVAMEQAMESLHQKPVEDTCRRLQAELNTFFQRLDRQDYIAAYKLADGTAGHFTDLAGKLFADPPVVARETDSLTAILKNVAHFYRVLGRHNIFLIKDLLAREGDNAEDILAMFYQWSLVADCGDNAKLPALPLPQLYEYCGYFLNTLGGQAYVSRRGARLRVLVRYYSVLILDRANDLDLNKYGIDIRYPLQGIVNDMLAYQDLKFRDYYLSKLAELKLKYPSG